MARMTNQRNYRVPDQSAGAKKVLNALENETKANFQENIPGKARFHKK